MKLTTDRVRKEASGLWMLNDLRELRWSHFLVGGAMLLIIRLYQVYGVVGEQWDRSDVKRFIYFRITEFNLAASYFCFIEVPSRSFQRGGSRSSRTRSGMWWTWMRP